MSAHTFAIVKRDPQLKLAPWPFIAAYYSEDVFEAEEPESKWWKKWLRHVRGRSVLGIGCGPTLIDDALHFSHLPKRLAGMDMNPENLRFLATADIEPLKSNRRFLITKNVQLEFILGDIRVLRDELVGEFDAVYAVGVLGMFEEVDLIRVINNSEAYLRPGGIFAHIEWSDCRLSRASMKLREQYQWYKFRDFEQSIICRTFGQCGWTTLKQELYNSSNPHQYGWGEIHAVVFKRK